MVAKAVPPCQWITLWLAHISSSAADDDDDGDQRLWLAGWQVWSARDGGSNPETDDEQPRKTQRDTPGQIKNTADDDPRSPAAPSNKRDTVEENKNFDNPPKQEAKIWYLSRQ